MNDIQLKLCDIQGRLLELPGRNGFESSSFIEAFMLSDAAGALDSTCNRMQWAGEEYLLTGLTICTDTGTTIPVKAAEKYTGRRLSAQ